MSSPALSNDTRTVPVFENGEQVNGHESQPKKQIILNAFDMSGTLGHLSPGQWKVLRSPSLSKTHQLILLQDPKDQSRNKLKLSYWTDLALLLERGNINALFLADSTAGHAVYNGSMDECIRRGAQFPIIDPSIPITAMAAVTKHLGFAITTSTSFEAPFIIAKRFSTLDHLTDGRFGWNIVTSYVPHTFRCI